MNRELHVATLQSAKPHNPIHNSKMALPTINAALSSAVGNQHVGVQVWGWEAGHSGCSENLGPAMQPLASRSRLPSLASMSNRARL